MVDQKMYLSGCIGLDPTTANLVSGGIGPETEQVGILCFLEDQVELHFEQIWSMQCKELRTSTFVNNMNFKN